MPDAMQPQCGVSNATYERTNVPTRRDLTFRRNLTQVTRAKGATMSTTTAAEFRRALTRIGDTPPSAVARTVDHRAWGERIRRARCAA